MPWIEVTEPYAQPPRVASLARLDEWDGRLELDRGWAELTDIDIGPGTELDLSGCEELLIRDCLLSGVSFDPDEQLTVEVQGSALDDCDMSRLTIRSLRRTRLEGCKLIGTDLTGATIADVIFDRCAFRYANLRMAKLDRVRFVDCALDDVDAYELRAQDVAFPGSTLTAVNLDRLHAERVDWREASELSFSAVNQLSGCLVAEHQLPALAPALAMAAGVDIERSDVSG